MGITIVVLSFLNLFKDNHCCIFRCKLLMNFDCLIRLIERYPAPGLNVRVFSYIFFLYRKETPTSRLKGVNDGLSPLYLQCLGIRNNACTSSAEFYSKAHNLRFYYFFHHSPFDILLKPEFDIDRQKDMSEHEWIDSKLAYAVHFFIENKQVLHGKTFNKTKKIT